MGVDLGEVKSGSRTSRMEAFFRGQCGTAETSGDGIVPYFINWGKSTHPAAGAPAGCLLKELKAEHPNPNHVNSVLKAFEIDLQVSYGRSPSLIALD